MTTTTTLPKRGASDPLKTPSTPDRDEAWKEKKRKRRLRNNIILQAIAMIGFAGFLWPTGANWISAWHHNAEISGYTSSVQQLTEQERSEALDLAHEYNQNIPAGVLRDPYVDGTGDPADSEAYRLYREILTLRGTLAMGELSYPSLGIGLPIYHGTSDAVLKKGVGHLFGSSLPIGGTNTHAALTSHTGQLHAKLFDNLLDAQLGQVFSVSILGKTTYYKVDQILTVTPEETEHLQIIPGEDHVTLITCTPIGINSHRLLVRGTVTDAPDFSGSGIIPGDGVRPGFPWWIPAYIGATSLMAYLLFAPRRKKKKEEESSNDAHFS